MTAIPTASPSAARAVLDPQSYADWDPLLDLFDELRSESPVTLVASPAGEYDPFWLVTGYDEVMRISKDNAGFLNEIGRAHV